jgi:hypothetical protein
VAVVRSTSVALGALLLGGCGGSGRQDAHEPAANFNLKVLHASFPRGQAVARPASLKLSVENAGAHTAPNVAVSIDSFQYAENYPELAASQRPIWVIERGPGTIPARPVRSQAVSPPGGGVTNYVNTWALGPLAPGATRTFTWSVVPVKSGVRTVHFAVAGGLAGKARAVTASGNPVEGQFKVDVAAAPPLRHVDPSTGQVVAGRFPLIP